MKVIGLTSGWWRSLFTGVMLLALTPAAKPIELGEPAPEVKIVQWFNGGPVSLGDGSNVCVVTFFESWCSSCMAALPQLNDCAEKFKSRGVRFLGISVEPTETVKAFAEEQSRLKALSFPVGVDKEHVSYDAYMKGFGRTSVPNSFVVDANGKLIWEGPPLAGLAQILEQVVSRTFDLSTARKAAKAHKLEESYFNAAESESDFKLLIANTNSLSAKQIGEQILADGSSNPWLLNSFAWRILTDPKLKNRDLSLAIKASKVACETDPTRNPSFVDTYARGLYLQGKISEAIAMQKHAAEMASDPAQRARLESILHGYEEVAKAPK
jgi:Peroxiredoxin